MKIAGASSISLLLMLIMCPKQSKHHPFTQNLLHWHQTANQRSLEWKNEKDPYKIWLSEIILQQTRAEQGTPYYLKFIQQYPTVADLANAPFEEVIKLWQGLGYYSRCANLVKAAQIIHHNYQNVFPKTYEEIIALPGVGPYTASAIASFAYNLPYPVIDGNVYRILARYFGIYEPVDGAEGKKLIAEKAQMLLDSMQPGLYNQAIMDLGATICKPQNPDCEHCPVQRHCVAYANDLQKMLPVKSKKIQTKHRYFHYIILEWNGKIYMESRQAKDIWQHLYQPLLIELDSEKAIQSNALPEWINMRDLDYLGRESQKLTHQQIHTFWYRCNLETIDGTTLLKSNFLSKNNLKKLALPKSIFSFMSKNNYF